MPRKSKSADRPTTLRERLAELTFREARDLLGPQGGLLLRECHVPEDFNPRTDLYTDANLLQLTLRECDPMNDALLCEDVVVSVSLDGSELRCLCSACSRPDRARTGCPHVATALSLVLDEKQMLGLVDPPDLATPLEQLTEEQLLERALFERRRRAGTEPFVLEGPIEGTGGRSAGKTSPWADYRVRSERSGHSYRVALRGEERGASYCDCPDFRTNTLGTCKHVEFALNEVRKSHPRSALKEPFGNDAIFVHVRYTERRTLHLVLPDKPPTALLTAAKKFLDRPIEDMRGLVKLIARLDQAGFPVTIYPDAEEMIARELYRLSTAGKIAAIRKNPAAHPLRTSLLKEELLPYQLDGIAFAVGAGRAILADETGLGKTIQAIGVAELLARFAEVQRVLVVCSGLRKSHWKRELRRCSRREAAFVGDRHAAEREEQNGNAGNADSGSWGTAFFTVCTYEQLLAEIESVRRVRWDLVVLDDGERLGDWQSKTTQAVKELVSPFALLIADGLDGCGIEDLYAIARFVDDRRLPPAFRFFHRHRTVDAAGNLTGYKDLATLREAIEPILLRRTRRDVLKELPPRSTRIVSIPMSPEQARVHDAEIARAVQLLGRPRLTEIDMLRIRKHLLVAQRACDGIGTGNGTDRPQPPGKDDATHVEPPKVTYLRQMLKGSFAGEPRKIVLFSEWNTMLDRIGTALEADGIPFVRLDEKSPMKKRRALLTGFRQADTHRVLLASSEVVRDMHIDEIDTVVHCDMPWKAAVLERRIEAVERTRRKKARQPLQMFLLLAENSLEERLLEMSHDESLDAAGSLHVLLDATSGVDVLPLEEDVASFRRRLLTLLGRFMTTTATTPTSALSVAVCEQPDKDANKERVAAFLASRLDVSPDGRRRLVIELDTDETLDTLAALIAGRMKK